jgi:hypothetical protein
MLYFISKYVAFHLSMHDIHPKHGTYISSMHHVYIYSAKGIVFATPPQPVTATLGRAHRSVARAAAQGPYIWGSQNFV